MPSARSPKRISAAEYQQLAAFRYALRRFLRFSENAAAGAGLPPQQHQALLAIKGLLAGGASVNIGALAEQLQIAHHSTVGLVQRLVQDGLVSREQGASDRRQVLLHLTPHGESKLEELSAAHRQELRRVASELQPLLAKLAEEG
jgi:DNA-binding MarR family transcriptional regulator